nr:ribonuclease H-like domain, reverse transcriptase, RNA-dependent DNA polymerase [Tanacetum cinerariifolium]
KPQDDCSTKVLENSGNLNPTASTSNPPTDQMETLTVESLIPTVSSPVPTAFSTDSQEPLSDTRLISKRVANQVETPSLDNILTLINQFEDILGVTTNSDESNGVEVDVSNIETTVTASPTPTLRIHKDHPKSQIINHVDTPIQTKNKSKEKTDPAFLQFCLFLCFLSQVEPKKISDALQDPSWVEAMQGELLQFKIQNVWTLVDCPKGVRPIGTKWVLKNKKDERGIVIKNKARLVAQGHTHEEGIDYDEVFALVARIEAIRLFLAYASFMGFIVYQMDVKSAFLYGTINEEVYSDVRSSNTPIDKENPWGKDETRKDVDLHLYIFMIGSLMYLTASRPDIMFAVCACARHQVTPKECHLHAVKRIFRYLKAYSDSDYGGATQDHKSTTEGCQFLGRRECKLFPLLGKVSTVSVFLGFGLTFSGTSKYWGVLRILMISLRLIPLGEHNVDFHPIVDFVEASPLRTVTESSLRRNLKL